jgi:hypothetical protein
MERVPARWDKRRTPGADRGPFVLTVPSVGVRSTGLSICVITTIMHLADCDVLRDQFGESANVISVVVGGNEMRDQGDAEVPERGPKDSPPSATVSSVDQERVSGLGMQQERGIAHADI